MENASDDRQMSAAARMRNDEWMDRAESGVHDDLLEMMSRPVPRGDREFRRGETGCRWTPILGVGRAGLLKRRGDGAKQPGEPGGGHRRNAALCGRQRLAAGEWAAIQRRGFPERRYRRCCSCVVGCRLPVLVLAVLPCLAADFGPGLAFAEPVVDLLPGRAGGTGRPLGAAFFAGAVATAGLLILFRGG